MNKLIVWLAIIWGVCEVAHFGWHVNARSDANIICDGIGFIILAIAFAFPNKSE